MNGYTPEPTNAERLAYDAERIAYWTAKSFAYAQAHDNDGLPFVEVTEGVAVFPAQDELSDWLKTEASLVIEKKTVAVLRAQDWVTEAEAQAADAQDWQNQITELRNG